MYDFKDLIEKHSVTYYLMKKEKGNYIDGEYIQGKESEIELSGTILPLSTRKLYQLGGSYTTKDMQLYSYFPLEVEHANVKYNGKEYEIEEDKEYPAYADVYLYILKWVKNFDKSKTDKPYYSK